MFPCYLALAGVVGFVADEHVAPCAFGKGEENMLAVIPSLQK